MRRPRQIAGALMLLSGVTHSVHYLFWDLGPTNTASAAVFGLAYFVIGLLLLRPGSLGPWLGAVVGSVGAVLATLVALANPSLPGAFHAAINWIVAPICVYLLLQKRPASDVPG